MNRREIGARWLSVWVCIKVDSLVEVVLDVGFWIFAGEGCFVVCFGTVGVLNEDFYFILR